MRKENEKTRKRENEKTRKRENEKDKNINHIIKN